MYIPFNPNPKNQEAIISARIEVIRMPNSIFEATNSRPQGGAFDIVRQYNSFRPDPFTFMLKAKGIQIPKEYLNDHEGAVRYLMNSGNLTQSDLQTVKDVANRMGINVPI